MLLERPRTLDVHSEVGRSLIRGGAWMVAARWAVRGLGLISTFIVARLLAPSDFGLIAMAMVVIGLVEVLGQTGQVMALIRHPQPTRAHYDSAWTLSVFVSAATTLLLWAIAGPAALYFHEPRAAWLIRILALRTLIRGVENIHVVDFRRDLQFDRVFVLMLARRVFAGAITIGLAFWWRDWRALAAGILGGELLDTVFSYLIRPYRPRFCISVIREMLAFSGWMLAISICKFINEKADELAVGGLGSATAMGAYNVSADVATAPTTETVLPATEALFPVFARISGDTCLMRGTYLDVFGTVSTLSVALAGGLALVAGDFVAVLLGPKWMIAVPLVRVLAVAGGLFAITQSAFPVLTAIGSERLAARLSAGQAIATLLAVGGAAWLGNAMAIAFARVGVAIILFPVVLVAVGRVLPMTMKDVLSRVLRPVLAGLAMAACVLAVHGRAPNIPALRLTIDAAAGATAYVSSSLLLWLLAGSPGGLEATLVNWVLARRVVDQPEASP